MKTQEFRGRIPSGIAVLVLSAGLACSGCAVSRAADSQVSVSRTTAAPVAEPAETAPFTARTPSQSTVAAWGRGQTAGQQRPAFAAGAALIPESSASLPAVSAHFRSAQPELTSGPELPAVPELPAIQPDFSRQAALPSIRPVRVDSAAVEDLVRPSVLHASTATFEQHVLQSELPVLVDFYADWCGPCKAIAPVLQEVAQESPQARVVKVNIDDSPELAARFGIESVPSLLVFKQGRVVVRQTGAKNKAQLKAMLGG